MPPIAITILSALVQYGPDLVSRIVAISRKPEATPADWDALFTEIAALNYDQALADAKKRAAP